MNEITIKSCIENVFGGKQVSTVSYRSFPCPLPTGKRQFDCPLCGYTSKYSQNVVSHMPIHGTARNWVCEDCGLAFVNNNQLKKHRLVHQKDRPLGCPLCDKKFKGKGLNTNIPQYM